MVTILCAGPVDKVLSWRGFLPLSRLTYCVYLVHPVVVICDLLAYRVFAYFTIGYVVSTGPSFACFSSTLRLCLLHHRLRGQYWSLFRLFLFYPASLPTLPSVTWSVLVPLSLASLLPHVFAYFTIGYVVSTGPSFACFSSTPRLCLLHHRLRGQYWSLFRLLLFYHTSLPTSPSVTWSVLVPLSLASLLPRVFAYFTIGYVVSTGPSFACFSSTLRLCLLYRRLRGQYWSLFRLFLFYPASLPTLPSVTWSVLVPLSLVSLLPCVFAYFTVGYVVSTGPSFACFSSTPLMVRRVLGSSAYGFVTASSLRQIIGVGMADHMCDRS